MRITQSQIKRLFRLLKRYPMLFLVGILLGGAVYFYEVTIARPAMSWMGIPESNTKNEKTLVRIFRNEGFMLGWSDLRGVPLWVTYELRRIPKNAPRYQRPSRFEGDWRAFGIVTHDTYTRSGYDRGHMAPNYAMSRLYGKEAQMASFKMSNICPQTPNLNQKLWQRIEEAGADYFTKRFEHIRVITGPLYKSKPKRLSSSPLVQVPDAFYKIFVGFKKDHMPQALAFITPQKVRGNEPLSRFLVTIDDIEAQSGFDFFTELEDAKEAVLESTVNPAAWGLNRINRRKSRY